MSALAKIKKQAAQLEHDRQYDKALALYARMLEEAPAGDEEVDVALFNRAGDVAVRAGDPARALTYYERALDLYASGGFLNNAIALGAKILRQAPERSATHYTLGVLYAKKGFRSDARQHLLTYAERMQRAGQSTEVARSMSDYLVLCDGVEDARSGVLAHVAASGGDAMREVGGRMAELLEHALRASGQLDAEADAAAPAPAPARAGAAAGASLVFIDLDGAAAADPGTVAADSPVRGGWDVAPIADAGDAFAGEMLDLVPTVDGWDDAPVGTGAELLAVALPADEAAALGGAFAGELPPLAPSMVAVDGRRSGEWSAPAWQPADAGDARAAFDVAHPILPGPPAFADDFDGDFGGGLVGDLAGDLGGDFGDAADGAPAPAAVIAGLDMFEDEPAAHDLGALDAGAGDQHLPSAGPSLDLLDLDVGIDDAARAAGDALPIVDPAPAPPAPSAVPVSSDDDAIDLGEWLRESEPLPSTRLVAPVMPTTGDEQEDFQATLRAFKAGIARNLSDADFEAHYDLGVAYQEMGLLEEAIGEFQKAARAPEQSLRALEALAACFLERGEPELVRSTLSGVAAELSANGSTGEAPRHVALCYLLGAAAQEVGRVEEARGWFLRVLATDYAFRDTATRLAELSPQKE